MKSNDHWHDLDERLRVVEAALVERAHGSERHDGPPMPETFWVLEGLRDRPTGSSGGVVFAGAVQTAAGPVEWQYGRSADDLLHTDEPTRALAADRLAAIGHPIRLQLVLAVLKGVTSTAELAELDGMGTTGQVYHHIRTLSAAGWLQSVQRGRLAIPAERVVPLLIAVAAVL